MSKILDIFKLIPAWVYMLIILVMIFVSAAQRVQVADLRTDVADEKKARTDDNAKAEKAASDHKTALAKLSADHAIAQQKKDTEYAKNLKARDTALANERVVANGLRGQLATYTSSGRRPGELDAPYSVRLEHRLKVVGSLLDESIGLVTEGRGIIATRDAEVDLLLHQIKIDRLACQAAP